MVDRVKAAMDKHQHLILAILVMAAGGGNMAVGTNNTDLLHAIDKKVEVHEFRINELEEKL